jgi:nitrite reductase (NAD(P)H)
MNCVKIGVKPRDELGHSVGIQSAERGGFVIDERFVSLLSSLK